MNVQQHQFFTNPVHKPSMIDYIVFFLGTWKAAMLAVLLGFVSQIINPENLRSIAAIMSIMVACYNLFINWPKFRERAIQVIAILMRKKNPKHGTDYDNEEKKE